MANEKISQLPSVPSATLADIVPAVQSGNTVQESLQQILTLMQSNIVLHNAGNPNGSVAGNVYQFCYDTTDALLYVCTTTGSASTAVWTPCIGQLTNGQLRIGSTGNAPVASTITAGSGITVNNTAGHIQISTSGTTFTWTDVTGATQTLVANNGYIADRGAGNVAFTLPAASSLGDIIYIVGRQNGWSVAQAAGQQILIASAATTVGVAGSIASTNAHDCVTMICTVANLEWTAISVIGTITVV